MLSIENSLVLVIDIQEKLVSSLENNNIVNKVACVVKAANILNIPTLLTEQYPKGLGDTVFQVKDVLGETSVILEKTSFNALLEEDIANKIKEFGKKQIVILGIETHICVYQTALALIDAGYEVFVVKDACASRREYEFLQGIDSMRDNGAKISCLETVLFEWLKTSKHPMFKEIQAIIK